MGLFEYEDEIVSDNDPDLSPDRVSEEDNNRGAELQEIHNQGEKDYADNNYSQPKGYALLDFLVTDEGIHKNEENCDAYNKGWENAKNISR